MGFRHGYRKPYSRRRQIPANDEPKLTKENNTEFLSSRATIYVEIMVRIGRKRKPQNGKATKSAAASHPITLLEI